MQAYRIVPMGREHIKEIAELERACFSTPWSERMLEEELDNLSAAYLVAEGEDGKVLGYAGLLVAADEGYITNVAVWPNYRRQGIACRLLEVFLRFAQERDLAFLTLEVRASNAPAMSLYLSYGFEEVGRRRNYYEHPREDAILMTRYFKKEGEGYDASAGS